MDVTVALKGIENCFALIHGTVFINLKRFMLQKAHKQRKDRRSQLFKLALKGLLKSILALGDIK